MADQQIPLEEVIMALGQMKVELMIAQKTIASLENEIAQLKGDKNANDSDKKRTGTGV